MIDSLSSNYSSYYSSSSTSRGQQLHKELFAKLDSNGDGAVDQDELKNALSQKSDNGILVSLSKNFGDLDSDGSGSLSSDEMAAMAPPPPKDRAPDTHLLGALDSDGDGVISSDELSTALQASGNSSTSSDTSSALLKILDSDSSGGISSDELKAALQAGSNQDSAPQDPQANLAEALGKMIASLSKQYQLDTSSSLGGSVNVAA
ncbi:XopAW family type III secretion system calcium-binding effector [Pseudomonas sp. SIMBA_021]|uniref:XopAW family type III secretion system calcium-binding effector n=1 Tax=unclassified Pseudomonas TaxID=196821 RepID=UPI00397ACD24